MNRVHGEVMDIITKQSEKVYEERNVNLLLEEERRRTRCTLWRKTWKRLVVWRGVWSDKRLFDKNNNEKIPFKYSGFQTFDKGRPILSVRMRNFSYLKSEQKQEEEEQKSSVDWPNKQRNNKCVIKNLGSMFENFEQTSQIYESLSYQLPQCQSNNPIYNKPILKARQIQSLKNNYANIIFQNIYVTKRKQKKLLELSCEIIKSLSIIRGTLYITNHDIKFFIDITQHPSNIAANSTSPFPQRSNIAFFQYRHPNDKQFTITWPLSYVRQLQRRRFLGKKSATQMFLIDNRSVLLNFASVDERNLFTKKIVRLRDKKCLNLRYHQTLEPKKILKKADFATAWSEWRISNFEYLMMLNALAGRSYHDLSQYPVFPWVITDYISPILNCGSASVYRPLSMNLAMMGDEKRRCDFVDKYNNFDTNSQFKPVWGDNEPYHFGSHYSNPGVVLHFLSRMMPMIQGSIALHDGKIDLPQRSFYSIAQSFRSVLADVSDLRELTPEFYQLPEIFLNRNRINFGTKMDGMRVDNVQLPQWCLNDPYKFVITLREILESEIVSEQLHHWIDLIFGYQQTGKQAEKALNKFHPLTYEDAIPDIDKIIPDMERQSIQIQIYNFGQTPSQLFQKNHSARSQKRAALKYRLVVDEDSKVKVFRPVAGNPSSSSSSKQQLNRQNSSSNTSQISRQQISASAVLIAKFVNESKIIGVTNSSRIVSYLWWPHPHDMNPNTPFTLCATQQPKTYNAQTRIGGFQTSDRTFFRFDQLICILSQGKFIARGGFWDGKIVVSPIADTEASVTYVSHHSTVTAMAVQSKERFVITGAKQGDVIVWNILSTQGQHWVIHKHVHDHTAPVMSISICERMLMFATVGFDGCCNIYSLIKGKLLRSITHPKMYPLLSVALSSSPLPSVAMFSEKDRSWNSFSLNGKRLGCEKQDGKHVVAPLMIRNSTFLDRLVYGNQRGQVVIRKMPYLETIRRNQVALDAPVLTLLVDPTRRFLLVGCGDGGLQVITDPLKIQSSSHVVKNQINQSSLSSSSGGGNRNNQRENKAKESLSSSTASVGSSTRQSLVMNPQKAYETGLQFK